MKARGTVTDYSSMFGGQFLLGTHLCRQPMPAMSELKADMELLRANGFNTIKLQGHWQTDEPTEGRYAFEPYEELIEHAGRLEIGVYFGLTIEQAPAWLYRKHPDCRMVGHDGRRTHSDAVSALPGDGKPGPCFNHPGARQEQTRFIHALVQRLGRYDNLVVWNVWQEITTNIWSSGLAGMQVCFCEHTLGFFREWLKQRYGDLDRLNAAWRTRYAQWQDIVPERVVKQGPFAVNLAWQHFFDNIHIGRVLEDRCQAIKAADPDPRPVFAHRGAPDIGSPRDWGFARKLDFLATSCYPSRGSANPWDDGPGGEALDPDMQGIADEIALRFDHVRSCNRDGAPIWAAEFQGGPKNVGMMLGDVPTPRDIRRWMLTAAAYGATGIHFWVTRAEVIAFEANGFSLLDSRGTTTPRFEEAGRIGRFLQEHPDVFAQPSTPRPEIGIIIDEANYKFCELMNLQGFAPREHLQYSIRGWYRLLWTMNHPVDFVDLAGSPEAWAARYKVLIHPFPVCVDESHASKLVGYVERGGTLISEAMPGRFDPHGFCNRGELSPILKGLFGVEHAGLVMVGEPGDGHRWTPMQPGWKHYDPATQLTGTGTLAGCSLPANLYIEHFSTTTAEPCAMKGGGVAGTVRHLGEGKAWLLGTLVGHSGTAYINADTRQCIARILALAETRPTHTGRLIYRRRVGRDREAVFMTNPSREIITESIPVGGWKYAVDEDGNRYEPVDAAVAVTVGPSDTRVLVLQGR